MKGDIFPGRRSLALCLSLAMLLACSVAYAEWTGTLYAGKVHTEDSDLEIEQPSLGTAVTLHDVAWDDKSFVGPIYYGIRVGYFFESHPHLGLEAEFIHPKMISKVERTVAVSGTFRGTPVSGRMRMEEMVQHFEISHGMNLLLFNIVGRYGFFPDEAHRVGRVRLVARAGLGPTIPHPESVIGGEALSHYETNGLALGAGVACEVSFSRNFFGFVEYKRSYADVEVDIPRGSASTTVQSNHFIFGFGASF